MALDFSSQKYKEVYSVLYLCCEANAKGDLAKTTVNFEGGQVLKS